MKSDLINLTGSSVISKTEFLIIASTIWWDIFKGAKLHDKLAKASKIVFLGFKYQDCPVRLIIGFC